MIINHKQFFEESSAGLLRLNISNFFIDHVAVSHSEGYG